MKNTTTELIETIWDHAQSIESWASALLDTEPHYDIDTLAKIRARLREASSLIREIERGE